MTVSDGYVPWQRFAANTTTPIWETSTTTAAHTTWRHASSTGTITTTLPGGWATTTPGWYIPPEIEVEAGPPSDVAGLYATLLLAVKRERPDTTGHSKMTQELVALALQELNREKKFAYERVFQVSHWAPLEERAILRSESGLPLPGISDQQAERLYLIHEIAEFQAKRRPRAVQYREALKYLTIIEQFHYKEIKTYIEYLLATKRLSISDVPLEKAV